MASLTRLFIIALIASMIGPAPGGLALAAVCCLGGTGPAAAADEARREPAAPGGAMGGHGHMAAHGGMAPGGHREPPAPAAPPESGPGLPFSDGAGAGPPASAPPACGFSACQTAPPALLASPASPPSPSGSAQVLAPEAARLEGSGHLDSIFRPPRS